MKKNFVVKTLASTLALAMVATSLPAMPASAAKAPALNQKSKTLYINENDLGSSFDFNVKNKVSGSTYKWTTSNKTIATVNAKNGKVAAGTKTGKATITCKITLKNKKTKTLKATVTVKENATKAEISNPVETAKIGQEVNFNKKFTTASGAASTDYQSWEIEEASNTAGATVVASNGKVTATKAGEYKVRVRAYQNKTKLAANDTVDSEWLTVKVAPSITAVAQTATTKVKVTFDDNMKSKVKATDFVIKNKATTAVQQVKDVTFSDDGKEVTLETFLSFADKATYTLTYDKADTDFDTTIGEVASLEITPATVVSNKATEIKVVAKNANGVDITSEKASNIELTATEDSKAWLDKSDAAKPKLTIFKTGDTAKLAATYHTYKYDDKANEIGAVKAEVVVTAVDATATTYALSKYTVATTTPNFDKVTENKATLSVGETTKKLYVYLTGADGKEISAADYSTLSVESGNDNMLLVDTFDVVNHCVTLTPVKEGSPVVIIKNKDGKAILTVPVVVTAERKATAVVLDKYSVTVTGTNDTVVGTATVKATVNDQYNNKLNTNVANPTLVSVVASTVTAPTLTAAADGTITVDATAATDGTYQFKVTSADNANASRVLTVVVRKPGTGTAVGYRLDVASNTIDNAVTKADDASKAIAVKTLKTLGGVDMENVVSGSATTEVQYTVTKDNKNVNDVLVTDGTVAKFVVTKDNGTYVERTAAGQYVITATVNSKVVDRKVITVTDSQAAVGIGYRTLKVTSFADRAQVIKDTCEFSFDGKKYTYATTDHTFDVIVDESKVSEVGNKLYFKTVKVIFALDDGTKVAFDVAPSTFSK